MILAIYCCGGQGRELFRLAEKINALKHGWQEIIFVDDEPDLQAPSAKVYTFNRFLQQYGQQDCEFIIASGEPYLLNLLSNRVSNNGYRLAKLIAPDASLAGDAIISDGCVVQEKSVVSCSVSLGRCTCIGFSAVVHHDVVIDDYCFIASGTTICGNARIGKSTYIGAGTTIRDGIKIGSNCIIGMGSVVVGDVPDNSVYYGNPARFIRANTDKIVFK